MLGRRVALLQPATAMDAGVHRVEWAGDAAPGLYVVRATAGGRVTTKTATVVR